MDIPKIGSYIRKVRKERGMTLDDLADQYIPRATLSSIERGISRNPTKINYLLRKLDIHLSELTQQEQEEKEEKYLDLITLENKINRDPAAALKKLSQLPDKYQGSLLDFLKGRCYFKLNQNEKSTAYFKESLKNLDREIDSTSTNLKPYCLNHLALIAFHNQNYAQALQFTNDGLSAFDRNGERKYLYTTLLSNRSIYLYNLGRTEEALKTIEQIKADSFDLDMDTIIGIYDFQAELNLKIQMIEEAFACAKKGLELALINDNYERQLELYITLSNIYKENNYLRHAEKCLITAIGLEDIISKRHQLILEAYLKLGVLYQDQQKYHLSQKILKKAIRIANKQNNMLEYTKTMLHLAKTYQLDTSYDQAIHYYKEVLQHAVDQSTKLETLSGLAQVYLLLGDNENYLKYSKEYFFSSKIS
ncbi:helix-turn-helix transcriptional regulator [Shimazuella sp. AN120528]|uniref:helix-turn-helix domain-containing protein n=1 Tax=Shimazuella soli TaxID=1892854 RepID=UPI001F1035B0|nr:helix-turn-helix transcriptional regulator [Shimazuella soli]MCH5586270.1 helix-turn-helix transcriptional regulator [Shimazuella soli]